MIQDGSRQTLQCEMFNLTEGKSRIGIDAKDEYGNGYELKTSSVASVSLARDIGMKHINKWLELNWIFSKWDAKGSKFITHYFAKVGQLDSFFLPIKERLERRQEMVDRIKGSELFSLDEGPELEKMMKRCTTLYCSDCFLKWKTVDELATRVDAWEDIEKCL